MGWLPRDPWERLALLLIGVLAVISLILLTPAAVRSLRPPTPRPTPLPPSPPPAAVLLQDELDRALQGVVTVVAESSGQVTIGTAFVIDAQGDLLTSADLVKQPDALRVIDNTGGSHAVRFIGTDPNLDVAEVRVNVGGIALTVGDATALQVGDAVAILASPKNAGLHMSTPGIVTGLHAESSAPAAVRTLHMLGIGADLHPANDGSPVLGPGGHVLGMIIETGDSERLDGYALPIQFAADDLMAWKAIPGRLLPLAQLPSTLVLRGIDEGGPPPATGLALAGIEPARASAAQDTALTLHGSGFTAGASLHVRFIPLAGSSGAFDGTRVGLIDGATISVTVPAGQVVQDYTVQLTNGDGTVAGSRPSFTVAP